MDIVIGLTVAGSVASIMALLLPADRLRHRVIHAIYAFVIVVLAGAFARKEAELDAVRDLQHAAVQLADTKNMDYTHAGFVQAGLGFLELHRATFPDAYARATLLCEQRDCWGRGREDMVTLSSSMEGLLRGIATTHAGR